MIDFKIFWSILTTAIATLLAYVAWNEKDKYSMKNKVFNMLNRNDIEKLVVDKQKHIDVRIEKIEEDVLRLENKIDNMGHKIDKLADAIMQAIIRANK